MDVIDNLSQAEVPIQVPRWLRISPELHRGDVVRCFVNSGKRYIHQTLTVKLGDEVQVEQPVDDLCDLTETHASRGENDTVLASGGVIELEPLGLELYLSAVPVHRLGEATVPSMKGSEGPDISRFYAGFEAFLIVGEVSAAGFTQSPGAIVVELPTEDTRALVSHSQSSELVPGNTIWAIIGIVLNGSSMISPRRSASCLHLVTSMVKPSS